MNDLKNLERELRAGRISRREFMKATSALGLAAAAGGAAGISAALSPAHAMPKRGGRFVFGMGHGSTTDSRDPGTFENDFTIGSSFTLYNFLTEIGTDGQLIGELAESWDSKDGKRWVFELRRGVEFHNGKSLSARDVVDSINHHLGEDSASAAKPLLTAITGIRADGNAVVIDIEQANADFPFIVSDYHIPIMPSKNGKPDYSQSIGTGPYMEVSYEPGVRRNFKRNPNYWKAGRAHFDEIQLITIADVSARTSALTTGEIHSMDRVEPKTARLLKRNQDIEIIELEGTAHYTIPMIVTQSPFDNNDVRLALKYALNREAMLQTVLKGYGYLGNDHPIGRGQRYYNGDLPQRAYDPERAKFHLKKAGYSSLTVPLKAADAAFAGAVDAAVLYKEDAAKVGITINIERVPSDGYWSNVWNTDNCQWCYCYWSGRPVEDQMFSTAYADPAVAEWNDAEWNHAEFNKLLTAARSELNETKRREMYYEMQRIVSDEGGTVVPVFNSYLNANSKKVAHEAQMASNWDKDGQRWAERWWFA
ncbi:MAG: ABC transporter substrate-binding protein [Gammaproteobacteria bacterium]|nr:ABC transporter substrate-binding protein [Gammaproteobacteria bacterium]